MTAGSRSGGDEIRTLTLQELRLLVSWAGTEGWNPGDGDAEAFYHADPRGFFGLFVDGRMAAAIAAPAFGASFGFIGLYICHPDFRGRGCGSRVWQAAMDHLQGRVIGLDGVQEQQANYRAKGFLAAYRTRRWSGVLPQGEPVGSTVVPGSEMLAALSAFDARHFPGDRSDFIRAWLRPPRVTRMTLREGRISGLAALRRCREGFKMGPLLAENEEDARTLLLAMAEAAGGEPVAVDVPEEQERFIRFLESQGFAPRFETARMYRGPAPRLPMHQIFGIATLELG